ncbi:MAG: flagellar basal-body MS-ring/collar protein FliF, partial [Tumebacillaceae bacterium]
MNQQLKQLFEKLVGYWKQLEKRQKRNLLIVGTFFVLTVALLSWFALRPNYVVVFQNQTPASIGAISQKLDELKIPHQDTDTSISVPEQYKTQAHVQMAMAGLPQTGTGGYGVFDKSSLGMTQDEFNVRYKQALEGNIQDDIQAFQGVNQAKVNIVMPDKQLFVTEQQNDGKASVVVVLDPGYKLSNEQVNGIQQLVSHSVPGVLPTSVSIVDQNGARLVDDKGEAVADGGTGLTKQQKIQNEVEGALTNKLRDALERLEGLDNVNVIVHADIDFNQTTWTNKTLTSPVPGG